MDCSESLMHLSFLTNFWQTWIYIERYKLQREKVCFNLLQSVPRLPPGLATDIFTASRYLGVTQGRGSGFGDCRLKG